MISRRVSRRAAFLSGLGTLAAGVLAGVGFDRRGSGPLVEHEALVAPGRGHWVQVASVTEMSSGAVRPFAVGAVQGFLMNLGGEYRARSRACTHMGCALDFHQGTQSFACPCHGAEFGLDGAQRFGPHRFRAVLPPLPRIEVRVRGDSIQVRTA